MSATAKRARVISSGDGAEITMKPRRRNPPDAKVPEKPSSDPLVAVLEMVATQRPDLLPWLVAVFERSPANFTLFQIADEWNLPLQELRSAAAKAADDLDRLEARAVVWIQPRFLRKPHLGALFRFAVERCQRVGSRRRQRLENIGRRLERQLELNRRRQWIETFIGGSGKGPRLDRRRIEEFLGE